LQIATRRNYGLVIIGPGINDDNGKISVDEIGFASKENFGLMKIGSGIDEGNAIIDVQLVSHASTSVFGVVKLGADFAINAEGATEVAKNGDEEMVIYDLAKMKVVSNGIVDLEENIGIYRTFLNEDLIFTFNP
jgi:hypothetical protein